MITPREVKTQPSYKDRVTDDGGPCSASCPQQGACSEYSARLPRTGRSNFIGHIQMQTLRSLSPPQHGLFMHASDEWPELLPVLGSHRSLTSRQQEEAGAQRRQHTYRLTFMCPRLPAGDNRPPHHTTRSCAWH